jgi:hypothetical protein
VEASSFSEVGVRVTPAERVRSAAIRDGVDWPVAVAILGGALSMYALVGFVLYTVVTFLL